MWWLISHCQAGPVLVEELVNTEGNTGFVGRENTLGLRERNPHPATSQAACNPFENKRLESLRERKKRRRRTLSPLTGWVYRAQSSAPGHLLSLRAVHQRAKKGASRNPFHLPETFFSTERPGRLKLRCQKDFLKKPRPYLGGSKD